MIVKMKQATMIMYSPKKRESLEAIKDLGILHLKKVQGKGADFAFLVNGLTQVEEAIHVLSKFYTQKIGTLPNVSSIETGIQLSKRIISLENEIQGNEEIISQWTKEQEDWAFWGDFNPQDFTLLAEKGYRLSLWTLPKNKFKKLPSDLPYMVVSQNKEKIGIVLLQREADESLEIPSYMKSIPLPNFGIAQLEAQKEELKAKSALTQQELDSYVHDYPLLLALKEELQGKIEFTAVETASTCEEEEKLSVVQGYIPIDACDSLTLRCRKEQIALILEDVDPDDEEVPVLVRNNKVVNLISPVFNLLGTIPGYREYDISPFFLAFFSLFFAMIVGDAGYGALLLLGCIIAGIVSLVKRKKPSIMVVLLSWLSFTTVVWGAITGSWFGYAPLAAEGTFLHHFVIPAMDAFNPHSTTFIMKFCFVVAVIHLTIAHTMNFIRGLLEKPVIRAFTQVGKLLLLYGLYFLVNNLLFGDKLPIAALYLIGIGFGLVIICSEQEGKFFKGVAKGFSNIIVIFLDTISMFSDIISYIRLSAVGMASLEIAKAFNSMAESIMGMDSKALGLVLGVIIIFFGHTLNLVLGGLSVVVHGVRLNMLEFSGHLGMEWTGDLYDPFRDRRIVKN